MSDKIEDAQKKLETREQRLRDFKWALGLNRLSLRLMGVWPGDDEAEGLGRLAILLRVPFMIAAMFFCLFLPQMGALALVIHELPLVIDNLMTSCAAFTCCIKLYFVWRSKQVLRPVIQSVSADWLRPKLDWEREAMIREASRARIFTVSGYAVLAGCYTGFAFAPLFGFDIRMISNITDYGEKHLLVQSYFPYDYSKSPNYEITQVSQLIAGFFIGMSVSVPDNYFGALLFHASAQFEILGANLENLVRQDDKALRSRQFNRRFGIFVDRHVHLMTMVTAVEYSFSFVIMAQIFCMSIMVCSLGFQILGMIEGTTADKPSLLQVLTLLGTLFTLMMHTLVDCFACETLELRSAGIFENVYNSRWYTVPKQSVAKDVIPMMVVSKNPRKLTAGKIFTLSLATYCSILKSTAGYISMLIAVNRR
ncbi:odorant receptor 35 [Nasonia vitripennis]|uniref:Odorant receptor n=1 Tax=Nasonia vitripennis TaxID=7425 RepID=A0A7M6W8I1_NASVI|nr:odorant receptor 35 [Nasonia vitripennis]